MPKSWGNGTEALNAVRDCVIRCLTIEESLLYLESKGFKISESKLRRIKKHIIESTNDRLDYIVSHECVQSHIDSIDTVKSIIARLWKISRDTQCIQDELRALELIPQNVKLLEALYDSSQTIASLSKKLDDGVNNAS